MTARDLDQLRDALALRQETHREHGAFPDLGFRVFEGLGNRPFSLVAGALRDPEEGGSSNVAGPSVTGQCDQPVGGPCVSMQRDRHRGGVGQLS